MRLSERPMRRAQPPPLTLVESPGSHAHTLLLSLSHWLTSLLLSSSVSTWTALVGMRVCRSLCVHYFRAEAFNHGHFIFSFHSKEFCPAHHLHAGVLYKRQRLLHRHLPGSHHPGHPSPAQHEASGDGGQVSLFCRHNITANIRRVWLLWSGINVW